MVKCLKFKVIKTLWLFDMKMTCFIYYLNRNALCIRVDLGMALQVSSVVCLHVFISQILNYKLFSYIPDESPIRSIDFYDAVKQPSF